VYADTRRRFEQATARLAGTTADTALQWHMLAMVAAVTGTTVDRIDTEGFLAGRALLLDAYRRRGRPESGQGPAAVLHRLQATLYHDQVIDTLAPDRAASRCERPAGTASPAPTCRPPTATSTRSP
jgi:hypothetical protein